MLTLLRSLIRLNSICGSPLVALSIKISKADTILSSWSAGLPVTKREEIKNYNEFTSRKLGGGIRSLFTPLCNATAPSSIVRAAHLGRYEYHTCRLPVYSLPSYLNCILSTTRVPHTSYGSHAHHMGITCTICGHHMHTPCGITCIPHGYHTYTIWVSQADYQCIPYLHI